MTPQQEAHLKSIQDRLVKDLESKYRNGQQYHGGNLWDRDVVADALAEAIDQATYLYTLRDKIAHSIGLMETATIQLHSLGVKSPDGYAAVESIKQLLLQAIESLGETKVQQKEY